MKLFQRWAVLAALLLMVTSSTVLMAQDDAGATPTPNNTTNEGVNVRGSGVALIPFNALVEASGVELDADIQATGTDAGLNAFCTGGVSVALAASPINPTQEAACNANNITFYELLVGIDAMAFVVNDDLTGVSCLTQPQVNQIFAPSARGQITTWAQVDPSLTAEQGLTVIAPTQGSVAASLLDSVVTGDGVRSDATFVDPEALLTTVAETPGAIGALPLGLLEDTEGVRVLDLQNAELGACFEPSASAVEDESYVAGNRLFAYVNALALQNEALNEIVNFIASESAAEAIEATVFVAPTSRSYTSMQGSVAEGTVGRLFTREVTAFVIPPNVAGAVNVGGNAALENYFTSTSTALQAQYPSLTINPDFSGSVAGVREFCSGNLDILTLTAPLSDEALESCAANNIEPVTFDLGSEAVVLLANAESDFLSCVTTEQIVATWAAQPDETLTETWNQVAESWPETPITLVAPNAGNSYADLMLAIANGQPVPRRDDVAEERIDPLYRAAAVANVEGGLTFMSWQDYQRVEDAGQSGFQVVEVNAGDGCIAPTAETIEDGTYPLTRSALLAVSNTALNAQPAQSLLWYIFTDANYSLLTEAGFVGLDLIELSDERQRLQTAFDEAAAAAAAPVVPEVPAEAEEEAAPEDDNGADGEEAVEPTAEGDEAAEPTAEGEEAEATEEGNEG